MNTPKLLPSLMCVDFTRMAQTLEVFEQCGIDALHVDIMDGEFVPNYALGTDFCRQLRKLTPIPALPVSSSFRPCCRSCAICAHFWTKTATRIWRSR